MRRWLAAAILLNGIPSTGFVAESFEFKQVATCRCTAKVQFLLNQEVPSGQTIYFIKDGKGAAHAIAP
ncbi:hypothetical protein [Pseudoxanthomonas sp.]|jgi:hypothetical protein|uniref:hypothetical protein n=1 Tax=Pseudoxanthomonas sp. TaxID=1871049 RepID=UPI002FDFA1D1